MIITIKNLHARTLIGVWDWERQRKRDLILNITLDVDFSDARESDALKDTVNYIDIEKLIIDYLEEAESQLLEHLLHQVGKRIIDEHPKVNSVTLEADKVGAMRQADSVSVELSVSR